MSSAESDKAPEFHTTIEVSPFSLFDEPEPEQEKDCSIFATALANQNLFEIPTFQNVDPLVQGLFGRLGINWAKN